MASGTTPPLGLVVGRARDVAQEGARDAARQFGISHTYLIAIEHCRVFCSDLPPKRRQETLNAMAEYIASHLPGAYPVNASYGGYQLQDWLRRDEMFIKQMKDYFDYCWTQGAQYEKMMMEVVLRLLTRENNSIDGFDRICFRLNKFNDPELDYYLPFVFGRAWGGRFVKNSPKRRDCDYEFVDGRLFIPMSEKPTTAIAYGGIDRILLLLLLRRISIPTSIDWEGDYPKWEEGHEEMVKRMKHYFTFRLPDGVYNFSLLNSYDNGNYLVIKKGEMN